jgi:N-acetylneuraminic acid mutarotase
MVIFGGFVDGVRSNEIFRYHIKNNNWEKIAILGKIRPLPRAGHSAISYGDSMIIFGGIDEDYEKLNDLWIFNFADYTWQ